MASWDLGLRRPRRLPVPVISVGNLAAGGTGKTPLVLALCGLCRERGVSVGVLARGYGGRGRDGLNDEGRMLARRFPDLPQAQRPDRYEAGLRLLGEKKVDLLVLDDGFQHRRLHRDLDLVCVPASDPFSGGAMLPAGWLREPPEALGRADLCLRVVEAGEPEPEEEDPRLAELGVAQVLVRRAALDIERRPGGERLPLETLRGRRVRALAGIARPERFARALRECGAEILERRWFRDHSKIPRALLEETGRTCAEEGSWLLLTEKDEARLLGADPVPEVERYVFRQELRFPPAARSLLESRLDQLLGRGA